MTGTEAPGLAEIMSHFAWDLPWLALVLGCAAAYLLAARAVRRRGRRWPVWRACPFLAGALLVGLAVLSPIEHYGNELLWLNFLGFLLLTMVAPPLLLLGAPLTLAFHVSGPRGRARLRSAYRGRVMWALTFPIVAWLLFAVVTYAWQFSGLTGRAAGNVFVRDVQQASLLLVALLFWMPALATDPMRWRLPDPLRALYVFVEMTHKGLFGGMFLSASTPFHDGFAANLPAWAGITPMMDQRVGILILWIGGNAIFLVALAAIVLQWLAYERRNAHRTDWHLALTRAAEARRKAALEQVFRRT